MRSRARPTRRLPPSASAGQVRDEQVDVAADEDLIGAGDDPIVVVVSRAAAVEAPAEVLEMLDG